MKRLLTWIDRGNKALAHVTGALLCVTALCIVVQVMVRFVLTAAGINISAPWTEELARYALIWMIFLGGAVGCRKAQMIALEFVSLALPARLGVPLKLATLAIGIAFFALLIQVGLAFVELGRTETSPVMGIEKSLVYWALPVGGTLMIVNTLALILESVVERRDIRLLGESLGQD